MTDYLDLLLRLAAAAEEEDSSEALRREARETGAALETRARNARPCEGGAGTGERGVPYEDGAGERWGEGAPPHGAEDGAGERREDAPRRGAEDGAAALYAELRALESAQSAMRDARGSAPYGAERDVWDVRGAVPYEVERDQWDVPYEDGAGERRGGGAPRHEAYGGAAADGFDPQRISDFFERDARRYDGGFDLY